MPDLDNVGGFIDDVNTGSIYDRETGQTFDSYDAFEAAYNQRHKEEADTFWDQIHKLGAMTWDSMFSDDANRNVYQRIAQSQMQSNIATANLWTGNTPYDPQTMWDESVARSKAFSNSINSNVNAIFGTLADNARTLSGQNPQEVSTAGNYLQAQGLDPHMALDLPQELKTQVMQDAKLAQDNPSWSAFIQQHQTLANWLQDSYNYARVKDDIKPQAAIASLIQSAALGSIVSDLRAERGQLYWNMANGEALNQEQQDRIKILNAMLAKLDPKNGRRQGIGDNIAQALGGLVTPLGQAVETAVIGGGAGATAGAVLTPAGAVAGGVAGAVYGGAGGFLHSMATTEGGNLYGDIYERTGKKAPIEATIRAGVSAFANGTSLNLAGTAYSVAKRTGILEMMAERALPDLVFNFFTGAGEYATDETLRRTYGIGNTETYGEFLSNMTANGAVNALFGEILKLPAYGFVGLRLFKDKLNETATMKRGDKDTQAEIINAEVQGTSLQSVQVPAEAVVRYMDRVDISEEDKADFRRIIKTPEQLDRAMQTGEYVDIDLGSFVVINDDFYNSLLKDARINNMRSLQEYQDFFDQIIGLQRSKDSADAQAIRQETANTENPELVPTDKTGLQGEQLFKAEIPTRENPLSNDNGIYNLFTEANNKDEVKADTEAVQKIASANRIADNNSDASQEVMEAIQDVEAQLNDNPLYQAQEAMSASGVLPDFSLTLFGSKGQPKNVREWAKNHKDGMNSDIEQAEVDRIAADYGFSSGAELIDALSKAPTRDEIRYEVTRQVQRAYRFENDTAIDIALERSMQKVQRTIGLLDDFDKGRDIQQTEVYDAVTKLDKKTANEIARRENQIRYLTRNYTVNGKDQQSVRDRRIEMLQQEIQDIKDKYKEDRKKAVEKAKAKGEEKVRQTRETWKSKATNLRNKIAEARRRQIEYAKNKRLSKKEAKEGQLTIAKAKEEAKRILANTPLGQITDRSSLMSAIRRASQKANRAYEIGDYHEAINQSNKVLSSLAYLQESYRIIRSKSVVDRHIAKLSRKNAKDWGTEDNSLQAQRVLYILGLRRGVDAKTNVTMTEHLRQLGLKTGRATELSPNLAFLDAGYANRPADALTLSEYQEAEKLLRELYRQGRETKAYYAKTRKETIQGLIQGQIETIENYRAPSSGRRFDPSATATDRTSGRAIPIRAAQSILNPDTFIVRMEGEHGKLAEFWIDEVASRQTVKSRVSHEMIDLIHKAHEGFSKAELRKMNNKNILIEEQGKITVSKNDLIGLALHAGSQHNWDKMFSISTRDGQMIPNIPIAFRGATDWSESGVLNMLGKYLTKKDWQIVQGYWDMFDTLWNKYTKPTEIERTHFTPTEAPKHAFSVTLDNGEVLNFKGGFMPLQRDARSQFLMNGNPVDERSLFEELTQEQASTSALAFQTDKSHLKARTNASYIVDTDFTRIIPSYLDKATTDLAYRDWIYTARNILNDAHFRTAVQVRYGDAGLSMFTKIATDCTKYNTTQAYADLALPMVEFLRQSNAISVISSPLVILQGLANPFLAVHAQPDFGVTDVIGSLVKYGLSDLWLNVLTGRFKLAKQFVDDNYHMSPLLQEMGQSLDSEMYNTFQAPQTMLAATRQDIGQITSTCLRWVDNMTTQPIFRGLVDKGLSKGLTEEQAIRYAERGIRRMIPSDKRYEQSQFMSAKRGSWQWFVSSLASYGVLMFNRTAYTLDLGMSAKTYLPMIPTYFIGCMVLMPLLTDILAMRSPLTDEKKEWGNWAVNAVVGGALSQLPIVGDVARGALSLATDEPYYGARTPSGLLSIISTGGRSIRKIAGALSDDSKVEPVDAIEAGARLASMTFGIPMYFNNLLFNGIMYLNDDVDPEFLDLFRRRPYEERR